MVKGILRIKPLSAQLIHDTKVLKRMSPYVIIKVGDTVFRTNPSIEGHLTPSWSEEYVFDLDGPIYEVEFQVKHEAIFGDALIGTATLNLGEILRYTPCSRRRVPLRFNGMDAGSLFVSFTYQSKSGQQSPSKDQTNESIPSYNMNDLGQDIRQQVIERSWPHTETVMIKDEPIIIREKPIFIENEIVKEQPIITTKETIILEQPVMVEKHEMHERVVHETEDPKTITKEPYYRNEAPEILVHKPIFEEAPKLEKHREIIQETPITHHTQPEVFKQEIITEKAVIHEKDIIEREKPIFVEKPVVVQKEFFLPNEHEVLREEPVIHPEMEVVTNKIPEDISWARFYQEQPQVIQSNPEIIQENPEIIEKRIMIEKPIIHEQPVYRKAKEIVVEKPEVFSSQIKIQEQPRVVKEGQSNLDQPEQPLLP